MSCNLTIMKSSVTELLRQKVGTNDTLFSSYISEVISNEEEKENNLKALKSASGFIRREVGRKVKLRVTPQIIFELDESIDYGMKIDGLIKKAKEQ